MLFKLRLMASCTFSLIYPILCLAQRYLHLIDLIPIIYVRRLASSRGGSMSSSFSSSGRARLPALHRGRLPVLRQAPLPVLRQGRPDPLRVDRDVVRRRS